MIRLSMSPSISRSPSGAFLPNRAWHAIASETQASCHKNPWQVQAARSCTRLSGTPCWRLDIPPLGRDDAFVPQTLPHRRFPAGILCIGSNSSCACCQISVKVVVKINPEKPSDAVCGHPLSGPGAVSHIKRTKREGERKLSVDHNWKKGRFLVSS